MTDPQTDNPTPAEQGDAHASNGNPADREEAIRQRAFEISQSEDAGSPEENWARAEREIAGS